MDGDPGPAHKQVAKGEGECTNKLIAYGSVHLHVICLMEFCIIGFILHSTLYTTPLPWRCVHMNLGGGDSEGDRFPLPAIS